MASQLNVIKSLNGHQDMGAFRLPPILLGHLQLYIKFQLIYLLLLFLFELTIFLSTNHLSLLYAKAFYLNVKISKGKFEKRAKIHGMARMVQIISLV